MHQLIVLGNGFDLECGLKSKFSDFFKERKEILYPSKEALCGTTWDSYVRDRGLTAWDIILCGDGDRDWYDIEDAIRQWVVRGSSGENKHCAAVEEYLACYERFSIDSSSEVLDKQGQVGRDLFNDWNGPDKQNADRSVAKFLINSPHLCNQDSPRELSIQRILLDELHDLEKSFQDYLSTQLYLSTLPDSSVPRTNYSEASGKLLERLITMEDWPEFSIPKGVLNKISFPDTSVLDFNYTDPISNCRIKPGALVNIHGSLKEGNTIFGIDGKESMDDPDAVPFTKTYRLLALNDPNRDKLVHTDVEGMNGVTKLIKFYGHSLNPADYSYFQAIFDGVDLYQSHTQLVFYYKPAMNGAREDMFGKVTRLMNTYGMTLDNKDHGKNLMHKLLLEGRLSIKPFTYQDE